MIAKNQNIGRNGKSPASPATQDILLTTKRGGSKSKTVKMLLPPCHPFVAGDSKVAAGKNLLPPKTTDDKLYKVADKAVDYYFIDFEN